MLEQYFLSNPVYRSSVESIVAVVIRVILLVPSFFERTRSIAIAVVYIIVSVAVDFIINIWYIFNAKIRSSGFKRELYILFKIIERIFTPPLHYCIHLLLTSPFWTFVFCSWVIVKNHNLITTMAVGLAVTGWIVVIPAVYLLLPIFYRTVVFNYCMVDGIRKQARCLWISSKPRRNKINWKQCTTLSPVKIKYGTFYDITEGFMAESAVLENIWCHPNCWTSITFGAMLGLGVIPSVK